MATQLKHTDFQPYSVTRPNLRVVFDTSSATRAVTSAIDQLPPAVSGATLEEIAIGADAEALIATARHVLSPHVYAAFLRWGAIAARFSGGYDMDEEGSQICDLTRVALEAASRATPLTIDDLAFKAYLLTLEASDGSVFGPIDVDWQACDFINLLARGVAPDLDNLSPVVRGINALAREANAVSSETTRWSDAVTAAIIAAFEAAQQVFAALPPETFTRREIERTPSRFYRGMLMEWDKAFASYQQAVVESAAATDESDPENHLGAAESYALHRLMLLPAPSPAALAIKARIYEETECWELNAADDIARVFSSDTRRFAKLGAFPQTDKPLLAAFETYRRVVKEHDALPSTATAAEEETYFLRMDGPEMALLETRATTVEGVIARLRYGFLAVDPDSWAFDAVLDPGSAKFRDGLSMDGVRARTLWGAIEDLARIAGVSLTEKAA